MRFSSQSHFSLSTVEPATDAGHHAVEYGAYRSDRRQQIVAILIDRGREQLARRVASCGNRTDAGTPLDCGRPRLCPDCSVGGHVQERYGPTVRDWDVHSIMALTEAEPYHGPVRARDAVLSRFDRFARRASIETVAPAMFAGPHVEERDGPEFRAHVDVLAPVDGSTDAETIRGEWRDSGGGVVSVDRVGADDSPSYAVAVDRSLAYAVEKTDAGKTGFSPVAQVEYALAVDGRSHYRTVGI